MMTDCLFCRIIQREIPADFVHEDGDIVAFRDVNPQAPVHILVVPRKHFAGFVSAEEEDEQLIGKVGRVAAKVAHAEGVDATGFRCVVNSGPDAQQTVPHLHMHVIGGRQMGWPPG